MVRRPASLDATSQVATNSRQGLVDLGQDLLGAERPQQRGGLGLGGLSLQAKEGQEVREGDVGGVGGQLVLST